MYITLVALKLSLFDASAEIFRSLKSNNFPVLKMGKLIGSDHLSDVIRAFSELKHTTCKLRT